MFRPGAVVGQEWKNLVENTLTAENSAAGGVSAARAQSPGLPSAAHGGTGSSSHAASAASYSAKSGSADALGGEDGEGRGVAVSQQQQSQSQQPRWHHADVKIDVLRELEDIAAMTLAETAFFCK